MFNELFSKELQDEMTGYFLNNLSKKGIKKTYKKGKIIDPEISCNIYIVTRGLVSQELIRENGKQMSLFLLPPGTIFGEMDFFEKARTFYIVEVLKKNTEISILNKELIDSELSKNPRVYEYFMHSIIRKYRILMLKLSDERSIMMDEKLANTLIRFVLMEEGKIFNGARIKRVQSITMFAKYVGCSRSTLSVFLTKFKEEGLIDTDKNEFIILDKDKLMQRSKTNWESS